MKKFLKYTALFLLLLVGTVLVFMPTVKGPALKQLLGLSPDIPPLESLAGQFTVPEGMKVSVFASNLPSARVMRMTARGDMLVSSTREGTLTLLYRDANNDGVSDGRKVMLEGLDNPHGFVIKDSWLYVSEVTQIRRFAFDAQKRQITGDPQMIISGLPEGGNHRTRTIDFGPDGRLYVSIGSSCNVCVEENPFRATIISADKLGKDVKIFARGLRNTVGFDWKQQGYGFDRLFGADNGRDLLGDDIPSCEFNIIREGLDYGWPHAYDAGVPDPDGGEGFREKAALSIHPIHEFGAHRAPLGVRFLNVNHAPDGYSDAALVALHGSWNSSTLVGYKVVSMHFGDDGSITEKDFMTGFLRPDGTTVIGRPVEIIQGPLGAIYVSDDYAGVIYSVTWGDLIPKNSPSDTQQKPPKSSQPTDKKMDPLAGLTAAEKKAAQDKGKLAFILNSCASCHVQQSAGDSYKPLQGLTQKYTIETLSAFLKSPPSPMPPPMVDEKGRRDLAIYLLSIETD